MIDVGMKQKTEEINQKKQFLAFSGKIFPDIIFIILNQNDNSRPVQAVFPPTQRAGNKSEIDTSP